MLIHHHYGYKSKKLVKLWLLLPGLLVFILGGTAQTQREPPTFPEPAVLTDAADRYRLGRHVAILEDPSGELTIDDVTSAEYASQFEPSQSDAPNFGYSDSAFWVRLPLRNESRRQERWLLDLGFASLHYVDLYTPLPGGDTYSVKKTGALRPISTRDLRHEQIVFDLNIPVDGEQTYFLRVEGGGSITLPLSLMTFETFAAHAQTGLALRTLFLGALLALAMYNVFLFFSIRDKSYLYLVLVLASWILFEIVYSGYADAYLISTPFIWNRYIQGYSFIAVIATTIVFADSFLELRTQSSAFHRLSIAALGVWAVFALLLPFTTYYRIATVVLPASLISLALVFAAGLTAWLRGFRRARYFMIAWPGVLIALASADLVRLGVLPSTMLSEHAYLAGVVWMAVCWSLALADRINLLRDDLQASERRLSRILDGLPVGVVTYGSDSKPTFANRRVLEILGNPARGIMPDISVGRTLQEAMELYSFRVGESDEKYPLERIPVFRALRGERAAVDDIQADLIDKRVPLEIWASPVEGENGTVESAVVAFQDITKRHNVQMQLEEYRLHLEELVEQRTAELNELNSLLNQEVAERKRLATVQSKLISWLSSVNEIQQLLGGTARLPQALEHLLLDVRRLTDAKSAFIGRLDSQTDQIRILGCIEREGSRHALERASVSCNSALPLIEKVQRGGLLVLSAHADGEALAALSPCLRDPKIESVVLAPARTERDITGFIGLGLSRQSDSYTDEETALFERIGTDLASLTDYAYLYDSARELAATEERNRLARDLHDSVTQVLFSASLLAEVLPQIWRRDEEQAAESLEGLRRLTRGALAEMRTLLLELRPPALVRTPLSDLISQLTEAVTGRTGLPFRLFIEKIPSLPEDVQVAMYRVAQESLNNVVKHAQATQVTVSLRSAPVSDSSDGERMKELRLTIADDGIGFVEADDGRASLGLSIMRERTAAIGGELTIVSHEGSGTSVSLVWTGPFGGDDE